MWRKVLRMVGVALTDFVRNNCHYFAAGIAYWALFSLFPLALAGISVLGFLYPTAEEQGRLVEAIINLIPVSAEYLSGIVDDVSNARGTLGGLAVAGLLWTGTAVFSAVRKGVNHAWHIGLPQYFLLERFIDLTMLVGVGALAFLQVVFTTNLLGLSAMAAAAEGSGAWLVLRVLYELAALAVTAGAFLLLYRYVPNTTVEWRDVWPGAIAGATLFQAVRVLFAWFISSFGKFNVVYGSIGALMAVLVWAYLSALAIMLGAQLAYTYRGVFGSRAGDVVLPKPRCRAPWSRRRRGLRGTLVTMLRWLLPPERRRE